MKIVILILVGAYSLACLAAYLFQSRMVYFPSREDAGNPSDVGLDYREVTFPSSGHRTLHGWMIPAEPSRYTLLFFHGNAGNITHRLHSIRQFVNLGLSVFIFDYAGYGKSGGHPGEQATYEDADAAWRYLVDTEGLKSGEIILFGRSLGGAVAIELATRVSPRALIAESCFTSIPELGSRLYPWLPVRFIARYRYNNMKKVPELRMPKLFVHSLGDDVVPFGMGKRLYKRAAEPKEFLRIRGSHNDATLTSEQQYEDGLRAFIDSLDEYPQRRGRR